MKKEKMEVYSITEYRQDGDVPEAGDQVSAGIQKAFLNMLCKQGLITEGVCSAALSRMPKGVL